MYQYVISEVQDTKYTNQAGVHQDGVLAHAWDAHGQVWAVLGHTNLGGISVWKGKSLDDLQKQYMAEYHFQLGKAGEAFCKIPYPDGPKSRGQIWPCGLWISPDTDKFYCFVHNETGWGAGETSYTVFGLQEGEPDYRHIGLMTSEDYGKHWDFQGWILTSGSPCWSELYPAGMDKPGQGADQICLGCGDFSVCEDTLHEYLYLFYTQHTISPEHPTEVQDQIFLARCPLSELDHTENWEKYNGSAFEEAGNCGKDTVIVSDGAVPCVCWSETLERYIMTTYHRESWKKGTCTCQLSFSKDLRTWSRPERISLERPDLSNPYFTIVQDEKTLNSFTIYMESNGTDIKRFTITILSQGMIDS